MLYAMVIACALAAPNHAKCEPPLPTDVLEEARFVYNGVPFVLTPEAIFTLENGAWSRLPLSRPLLTFTVVRTPTGIIYASDDTPYVHGIYRIDPATGLVSHVVALWPDQLSAQYEREYATDLVADLEHPGCVLAAIGYSHQAYQGGIARVCGTRFEWVFDQPKEPVSHGPLAELFAGSVMFDSIHATEHGWVAIGDGNREFTSDHGVVTEKRLRHRRHVHGEKRVHDAFDPAHPMIEH